MSNPHHAKYGQFLTLAQINDIVAPPSSVVKAVLAMLPAEITCTNHGDALQCSGPISAVEVAFETTLVYVKHVESGLQLIRQIGNFSVPKSIGNAVSFVSPLSHYTIPERRHHARTQGAAFAVVPGTITTMYNITEKGDARSSQGWRAFVEWGWDEFGCYMGSDVVV